MADRIIYAIYHYDNNLEELERLVQTGRGINGVNNQGDIPLHYAVTTGAIEIVMLLVEHGADVNSQDRYGSSPLRKAIWKNNIKIAEYLIDRGADVNARNREGDTLLMYTIKNRVRFEFVRLLIENDADLNAGNNNDFLPLRAAILNQRMETIRYLVENGANINVRDTEFTPLDEAIRENNFEIFKFLVDNGADVNLSSNRKEFSPLHSAIQRDNIEMIKYLVEHGARLDIPDYQGITAFQYGSRFYWEPGVFYGHRNRNPLIIDYFQNLKRSRVKTFFETHIIGRPTEPVPDDAPHNDPRRQQLPDDVLRTISGMAGNTSFGKTIDSDIRYLKSIK